MLVAVAAMAFVGCEQDIEVNATTEKTAVRVIAGLDETRSGFGDKINGAYDQVWNGGEVLSYHHYNYEQYRTDNSNVTLPEGESKKAEFDIQLTGVGNAEYKSGVICIASPASSATAVLDGFTIKVPTEQTPLANSVDPAAHILTSTINYYDGVPSTIEAQFEHAVAYGKMTLNNLPEGNYDYVTISLDNRTYKLYTTNVQNNVFWFGCEAVKPTEVKVSVVNETENKAYTKTLDLTKATNFEFVTGRLGSFSVEMEGVEPTTPEGADTFNPDVFLNAPVKDTNNGTCFKFTFKDNSINYYRVWLAEENRANDMMAVGNYKGNGAGNSDNYQPDASHFAATMYDNWGRVQGSYARHHTENSTLDVTYADGAYTIIITHNGTTYGYKGMPEGWEAPSGGEEPGEGGGEEPGEGGGEEPGEGGDEPEIVIDLTSYTKCNLYSFSKGAAEFVATFTLSDAVYGDQYTFSIADVTGINVSQKVVKAGEYTFVESFNSCEMEASDFYYLGSKYNPTGTVTVYNQDGTYTIKVDAKVGISSLKFYYQGTL